MSAAEIKELLTAQPFKRFRIHMSDGKAFDLTHPDMVIVTPTKAVIGVAPTPEGIADHVEHCSLLHITRLEELEHA